MHPDTNRDLLSLTPMWQWVGTPRFSKACLAQAIFTEEVRLFLEYRECLARQNSEQQAGDTDKMEGVVADAAPIPRMKDYKFLEMLQGKGGGAPGGAEGREHLSGERLSEAAFLSSGLLSSGLLSGGLLSSGFLSGLEFDSADPGLF